MAINPLLLNVKPISEITTVDNPTDGYLLFYDGGNELKKVDIVEFQSLIGGIAKPLAISDASPTVSGWYKPTTVGTYANAGNLVAQSGYDTLFYFDGTTWSKVEVALPMQKEYEPYKEYENKYKESELISGKYIRQDNGNAENVSGFNATPFIKVYPNKRYVCQTGYKQFAFYDENFTYIPDTQSTTIQAELGIFNIIIPANAKYIRLTVPDDLKSSFFFMLNQSLNQIDNNCITVKNIGGDFNSIVKAKNYADSLGYTTTIRVGEGIWTEELNFTTGLPHRMIGESRNATIFTNLPSSRFEILKVKGGWYFENIKFLNGGRGYAVHADYAGAGAVEFFNCTLESYEHSAIGSGSHQDQHLILNNCNILNTGAYIGAPPLYWHNNVNNGVTNQKLIVINCNITTNNEQGIRIDDANKLNGGSGNEAEVIFINTSVYSVVFGVGNNNCDFRPFTTPAVGKLVGDSITLSPRSFGNNVPKLNFM